MGREAVCTVRYQGKASEGKALLETRELLFRGDFRLKIPLAAVRSVTVRNGGMTVVFGSQVAEFALGRQAAKWADAIMDPPTLLDKLGVGPKTVYALAGALPSELTAQLPGQAADAGPVDVLFFGAETAEQLRSLQAAVPRLSARGALWVVYPKRVPAIRELDVLEAGRTEGFADTKVAAISPTHTGIRFARRRGL